MSLRTVYSAIFLLLISMFIVTMPTVQANSGQTYQVNTTKLQVRDTPVGSGDIVGQLSKGDKVTVFQESYGWAQTYYNGKKAWIAAHYLSPVTTSEQTLYPSTAQISVTVDQLRVRSGPGTHYQIIASTNKGDTYEVQQTSNDWYQVILSDGSVGWIASWYTTAARSTTQADRKPASQPKQTAQTRSTSNSPLQGYNIVLDPGHGGKDTGSISFTGVFEKDVILSTADKVANKLREAGATVILTRTTDRFLSLSERVSISNAYNTHAFISLHYDAYHLNSANGFSTHFYTPFGRDHSLAQSIQSSIAEQVDLKSRGVMESNLYVLRENRDLAVLVELGFLTNPSDLATIQKDTYQSNVARGITNGVINYFK